MPAMRPDRHRADALRPCRPARNGVRRKAAARTNLRHTFTGRAVPHGVPVPVVAQLPGHRGVPMTIRCTHVADGDTGAAAGRIGPALSVATDGERPPMGIP